VTTLTYSVLFWIMKPYYMIRDEQIFLYESDTCTLKMEASV